VNFEVLKVEIFWNMHGIMISVDGINGENTYRKQQQFII